MKKKLLLWGIPSLVLLVVVTVGVFFVWHRKNTDEALRSRVPETADTLLFVNGHLAVRTALYGRVQEMIREELKKASFPENLPECRLLFFANIEEEWAGVVAQFREGQAGAVFKILQKECEKYSSRVKFGTVQGLPQIKKNGSDDEPDMAITLCDDNLLLVTVGRTDPALFRSAAPNPLLRHIRFDDMILSAVCSVNSPVGEKAKKQNEGTTQRVAKGLRMIFKSTGSPRTAEKQTADALRIVPSLRNLATIYASVPFSPDNPVLDFRAAFNDAPSAWETLGALNVGIGCIPESERSIEEHLKRGVDKKTLFVTLGLGKIAEKILKR